jgi:hypothetical protein
MWYKPPVNMPSNEELVWCRVKYYYGVPFQAVYYESSQEFISVDNSIIYPAWSVSRWSPVT